MDNYKMCSYCGQKIFKYGDGSYPTICSRCGKNIETGEQSRLEFTIGDYISIGFGSILIIIAFAPFFLEAIYKLPFSAITIISFIMCASLGIIFIWLPWSHHKKISTLYELSTTDKIKYQEEFNRVVEKWISTDEKRNTEANNRLAHTPACPICGSKQNVVRVTALDRSVSTAVWGVASDAIGKQWECTACHHKFNADTVVQQPATPTQQPQATTTDPTEELRKYKKLLDDGVITKEDFEKKKNQLLGL